MGKKDPELISAKNAFKNAQDVGNRREEARWANVIGDIHKKRGEYCEALKWLRIDYQISSNYLLLKDRLPSCQTIGELYLCLQDFENALYYQKEHLELAKEAEDLVEEQRATTQLGRTYHELFNKSEDAAAIHKAKMYFDSAMTLARSLKENPPDSKSTYLKEYIDAYNNVGMLEMDLENFEKAETILTRGLEICDEEEVSEDDDGRSRLHHNLGFVYTKLRMWNKAREHIRKDIEICHTIGHRQGEAKGYINLGELFGKFQKYSDAVLSYKKALQLAKSMDDEFALARQVEDNIRIVKECAKVMEDIIKEEQNCKKLRREWYSSKGTSGERKCMKQVLTSLDHLLEKSHVIAAWESHLKFAKLKKQVATEFCDKEKLADSYDAIGESYQQLRDFQKARKWFSKSLDLYEVLGNLEGKAMVKINIGSVMDSVGDPEGALKLFEEAHRIANEANKISLQLMALDNMHYCYMMRFDNVEEVRRLKQKIEDLKVVANREQGRHTTLGDSCSETDTEGSDSKSENRMADLGSLCNNESLPVDNHVSSVEEIEDDEALSSLFRCRKLRKLEKDSGERVQRSSRKTEASPKISDDSLGVPLTTVSRKRNRLVLSDDEEDAQCSDRRLMTTPLEDVATSNELKSRCNLDPAGDLQDVVPDLCKHDTSSCSLVNHEESFCSHKSSPLVEAAHSNIKSLADDKCGIRIKVEGVSVCIELESRLFAGELDIEALKVQAACSYYLQLSSQQRSTGLLPIIRNLKFGEHILTTNDALETILSDAQTGGSIEASIEGHVQKRLIKLYVDCCQRLSELPNLKLLMRLYNLQISEDEVIVSDCEVQDMSVVPLLEALSAQKTISMLNLSHNMLGNATMEKLKQALTLSGQKYGALVLDLHCNLFGPAALFQICECPVLFNRLEVLNISGNRLTDTCGSYLFTILSNCKGLYCLNIERCSITSRTIQKVADALDVGSILSQLYIGYNNPISNSSLANLLGKLAKLERFSDLSLDGIKLSKHALDSVCQLARSSSLSGLMLGATNIGSDGASKLTESLFHDTQELAKLNLSYCALRPKFFERFGTFPGVLNILELNLAGNPITSEGGNALASLLSNPECCVKLLLLNKCQLGLAGVIQIIKSLAENESLEELNLAGNIEQEVQHQPIDFDVTVKRDSKALNTEVTKIQDPSNVQDREDCSNQLEVADSYDNDLGIEGLESRLADTCSSQNQHIEELSASIGHAKHLQLLDLSNNGFSAQVVDTLYTAWRSCTRVGIPRRHVNGQSVHFSIKEKTCCGIKPCCKN